MAKNKSKKRGIAASGGPIKSVRLSSGKRVALGSDSYNRRTGSGESAISGTGKNLNKRDIGKVRDQFSNFEDEISTTAAKRDAMAQGKTLPFQDYESAIAGGQKPPIPEAPELPQAQPQPGATQPDNFGTSPLATRVRDAISSSNQTLSRFRHGFNAAQSAGAPAPIEQSGGMSLVQGFTPPAPTQPQIAPVDPRNQIIMEDPFLQHLLEQRQNLVDSAARKDSFSKEVEKLIKRSGIQGIDTKLADTERLINGSEDSIRQEIQATGGMGTDQQVRLMAMARQKPLIEEYNNLVDLRKQKQDHLNTMIQMAEQDRAYADQQFEKIMDFDEKIAQYRSQFVDNARGNIEYIIENAGWDGAYEAYGGDPSAVALAERVMGLPPGGFQRLANRQQTGVIGSGSSVGGGSAGGISSTTQAIINNPSLFDDLTPTERGKVITQLEAGGYDTSNLGLKGMSDAAITAVSQTQKAIDDLNYLKTTIRGKEEMLGPVTGLARFNPYSQARKLQADVDRVRQTVGKALEGGVLRKEDEDKYKKILATLSDTPSTALYKIDALIGSIQRDIENYKSLQQSSGRSLNVRGSLQKRGSETKPEDLRAKYNY